MAEIQNTNHYQMLTRIWSNRNSHSQGKSKAKQRKTHSLLVEMHNGTVTLEDSLIVSYKAKHSLTT